MSDRVRVGITLPSFVRQAETALEIARVAESSGVDGVFVYDHLFRVSVKGARRPALEAASLLGAVSSATTRVTVGTLVLRASLRPPASVAAVVETAVRLAPGRLAVGIGAGDSESQEEMDRFGLDFESMEERISRLALTTRVARDRGAPVWIGGRSPEVRAVAAAEADGWNAWSLGPARFAERASELRAAAARPTFECSWAGLVVIDETDAMATDRAEALQPSRGTLVGGPERIASSIRDLVDAGADWVILGAVDATDPRSARLLGEAVVPLLVP